MFERILVPLDGSPRAERALVVAARLARASQGTVTLVRVVSPSGSLTASRLSSKVYPLGAGETALARATHYLDSIALSPVLHGIPIRKQALFGSVAGTILSIAESTHSDLIVMGRHGDTGLPGWMLGSVSEKVAQRVAAPILLLHEGGPIPTSSHLDGTLSFCALVPLDETPYGQEAIESAVQWVTALAVPAQARIHLLRVVPTGATPSRLRQAKVSLTMTALHIYEKCVAPAAKHLRLTTNWSLVVDNDVPAAILRTAETGEGIKGAGLFGRCDLIVMVTHEQPGLRGRAWGSVTERVLHETRLPILMVRPTPAAPASVGSQHVKAAVQEFPR